MIKIITIIWLCAISTGCTVTLQFGVEDIAAIGAAITGKPLHPLDKPHPYDTRKEEYRP
jgi:hypothetical protein